MRSLARVPIRVLLSISAAAIALGLALSVPSLPRPALGLHLGYEDGQVVVVSVDYGSIAQVSGLRPGQVVVMLDDQLLPSGVGVGQASGSPIGRADEWT